MVQITGRYEPIKSENFAAHLMYLGLPEDLAKGAEKNKSVHEITHNGDKITMKILLDNAINSEFTLNKEIDEKHGDIVIKTTSTLDGDTLTLKSKYPNGRSETKIFKFSDSGLTITFQDDDPKTPDATRVFKRL